MKRLRLSAFLLAVVVAICLAPIAAQTGKRPLEVSDVLAFKSLGVTTLSPNGAWLAYRMAPQQGDGDVIVRNTTTDKEMKFPVGEGGGTFSFSDDSSWIAIGTSPTKKEADAARRANRTLQNGLTLVNLATGEQTAIAKIRRFAFNGELGGWIAVHRYGPEAAGAGGAGRGAAGGGRGAARPRRRGRRRRHRKGQTWSCAISRLASR